MFSFYGVLLEAMEIVFSFSFLHGYWFSKVLKILGLSIETNEVVKKEEEEFTNLPFLIQSRV